MRFRLSGLYATGDSDPYNNVEGGFDAIFKNPIFGGADTHYWIRQTIHLRAAGAVISSTVRGILDSLKQIEEEELIEFQQPDVLGRRRRRFRPVLKRASA